MNNQSKDNLIISVISNIIFEPYFEPLIKRQFIGYSVTIYHIPYGEHTTKEYKKQLSNSNMIIIWLNFESMFYSKEINDQQQIDRIAVLSKALYTYVSSMSPAQILWISFEDYYCSQFYTTGYTYFYDGLADKINVQIYELLYNRVVFLDLKHIIAEVGIHNAYDMKGRYRWNAPYSKTLVEAAVKEIHKQYLIEKGITKKCLVLDCDNVLWGGILSEDGIENLKLSGSGLGRVYQDFQRFVLSLYYHGVILAVCSKNDLSDILTMFREHSEMILKEKQIACFQVNWEDKPSNIKIIADKLNIGLDSMVFVDDSFVEIEAVKALLPEVNAILFKRDMEYKQFSCFNLQNNISVADIEKRNETYRTNGIREELKAKYTNYTDYIKALGIRLDIHEAVPIEYSRISELTQRTNKCTNGKRYTVAEIQERVASDALKLYSVYISDRFSDLGLVGVIEIERDTLTLFSLSCRALGREVERKMIEFILDKYQIKKIEFESTGKNETVKIMLKEALSNAVFSENI